MNRKIEEYALNAWPALKTYVHDGWLLRFSEGYTKRSNSVSAIFNSSNEGVSTNIAHCEDMYTSAGLNVVFKITPFVPETLDQELDERNYQIVDHTSVRVLDTLDHLQAPSTQNVEFSNRMNEKWLSVQTELSGLSANHQDITRRLLTGSPYRSKYVILYEGSEPAACGLGVIEDEYVGLYDIITAETFRNQGYGEQLLLHILNWARSAGAEKSYLMVVKNNQAAIRLYSKFNYHEIYSYWYRVKTRNV
ncbi:GNAT family N-acetyltransferase [Paenibacillus marinisediminis]